MLIREWLRMITHYFGIFKWLFLHSRTCSWKLRDLFFLYIIPAVEGELCPPVGIEPKLKGIVAECADYSTKTYVVSCGVCTYVVVFCRMPQTLPPVTQPELDKSVCCHMSWAAHYGPWVPHVLGCLLRVLSAKCRGLFAGFRCAVKLQDACSSPRSPMEEFGVAAAGIKPGPG